MGIDQVELLTHEKNHTDESHPREVHQVLDSLAVQHGVQKEIRQSTGSILNSISQENEESLEVGDNRMVQSFLRGLSWATYAIAFGAVVLLFAWVIRVGMTTYLIQK